jgi:hypothetical protein
MILTCFIWLPGETSDYTGGGSSQAQELLCCANGLPGDKLCVGTYVLAILLHRTFNLIERKFSGVVHVYM